MATSMAIPPSLIWLCRILFLRKILLPLVAFLLPLAEEALVGILEIISLQMWLRSGIFLKIIWMALLEIGLLQLQRLIFRSRILAKFILVALLEIGLLQLQ